MAGALQPAVSNWSGSQDWRSAVPDHHHVGIVARWVELLATQTSFTIGSLHVHPTTSGLPGGAAIESLVNGIQWWALILALAGLIIGAAVWALGSHSQNYQQAFAGKRAVLVSAVAALVIGAAPVVITFFFHTGTSVPGR